MKVASYTQLLKNLTPEHHYFFFYGSADDLIQMRCYFLHKFIEYRHCCKISVRELDNLVALNESSTLTLFTTKVKNDPVFYNYASTSLKSLDTLINITPQSSNFLAWNGGALATKHALVQAIVAHPHIAAIPTYECHAAEIEFYCQFFLSSERIHFDQQTLQELVKFHVNDWNALPVNLNLIYLYTLKSKILTLNDLPQICLNKESEDFKSCAQALIAQNKAQFISMFRNIQSSSLTPLPFFRYATAFLKNSYSKSGSFYYSSKPTLTAYQASKIIRACYMIENHIKRGDTVTLTMMESILLDSMAKN